MCEDMTCFVVVGSSFAFAVIRLVSEHAESPHGARCGPISLPDSRSQVGRASVLVALSSSTLAALGAGAFEETTTFASWTRSGMLPV